MAKKAKFMGVSLILLIGILLLTAVLLSAATLPEDTSGMCPLVNNTPFFTIAYGAVTVNGTPASVGTIVQARSPRGDIVGCFEIASTGNFGAMYVYGEDTTVFPPVPGMRTGETILFFIDGSSATAAPTLTWTNDQELHQISLLVTGPTATPSTTATATNTITATSTNTITPTSTPTATATNIAPPTSTNTITPTNTPTATAINTATATSTSTSTPTIATNTTTPTATIINTLTNTPTPTATSTVISTPTATSTETSTPTATPTGIDHFVYLPMIQK